MREITLSFQIMDDQTAFVLALQLIALCTVVSALILYLMCKIPRSYFSGIGEDGNFTYQNIGGGGWKDLDSQLKATIIKA